jgi:hypothetical protein
MQQTSHGIAAMQPASPFMLLLAGACMLPCGWASLRPGTPCCSSCRAGRTAAYCAEHEISEKRPATAVMSRTMQKQYMQLTAAPLVSVTLA